MRTPLRALLLSGAIVMTAAHATAADLPADVAPFIQEAIANGDYVGAVVVLVDNGQIVTRGFGTLSKETKKAPDENTVFQIGSITKTFTATLLADAVNSGKIKLNDTVQSLLPAGVTIAQVGDRPMTIEDLATHRSGLPRLEPDFSPADPADPYADIDDAKLWRTIANVKPARAPGVAFEYSNLGYGLLGRLVAKAEGKSYQQLVAEKILKPLGMASSSAELPEALKARAAQGYDGSGKPVRMWTFKAVPGAGAINSTAKDMTAYLRANMAAVGKTTKDTPLNRAMSLALTPRADMAAPGQARVGLAWLSPPGGAMSFHDGGTYGFSSFIGFSNDGKRGALVLANTLQTELTDGLGLHLVTPATPLPKLTKTVALPAETLENYVGSYAMGPLSVAVMRQEGQLSVQITGQPASPVFANAPDRFYYKGLPVLVDFDRDTNGKVMRLVFHQQGQRYRAPHIGPDGKPMPQPERLKYDAAALDAYVGDYQIAPNVLLRIMREDDHLMAQLPQQQAAAIFSERPDHFEYELNDVDLDFERGLGGAVIAVTASSGSNKGRAVKVVNQP